MRVGFVCGAFDLLHAGHVHLLRQCKQRCDKLIVGLHVDPSVERKDKNKPVETIFERQIKLMGCNWVDNVIVYEKEEDIPLILNYFNFDVRFLGTDYAKTNKSITEESLVPIVYIDSMPVTSSSIRQRIKKS